MKRPLIATAAFAALLAFAAPARAGDFSIFGAWADTKDMGDSFGGGAKVDFTFGESFGMEFRGTYFPDLGETFEDVIDDDDNPLDLEIESIPIDGGFTFQFGPNKTFFISGGATYYVMDTNVGNIDDQWGWYGAAGFKTGNAGGGVGFFAEVIYRDVDGSVDVDPEEFEDIDDIDFNGNVPLDVGGIGVNAGIVFRF